VRGRQAPRELNRLDIKNRAPLTQDIEQDLLKDLQTIWAASDAIVVLDQVSEPECGVMTTRSANDSPRWQLADPVRFVLADSRETHRSFRNVC